VNSLRDTGGRKTTRPQCARLRDASPSCRPRQDVQEAMRGRVAGGKVGPPLSPRRARGCRRSTYVGPYQPQWTSEDQFPFGVRCIGGGGLADFQIRSRRYLRQQSPVGPDMSRNAYTTRARDNGFTRGIPITKRPHVPSKIPSVAGATRAQWGRTRTLGRRRPRILAQVRFQGDRRRTCTDRARDPNESGTTLVDNWPPRSTIPPLG